MNWVATSRTPIEKPKDLDNLALHAGDKRKKGIKAQLEAATKAAAALIGTIDGPAHVSLSGHAPDEDSPVERIVVEVARVSE